MCCVQGSQLNFGDTDANFTGIGASVFLLVTLLMFTLVTLMIMIATMSTTTTATFSGCCSRLRYAISYGGDL